MHRFFGSITIALLLLVGMAACGTPAQPSAPAASEPAPTNTPEPPPTATTEVAATEEPAVDASTDLAALKHAALTTYADIVFASYEDSLTLTMELQKALQTFVTTPSAENHQAAKSAWLAVREVYGQTEAYRFYGGPIDDEDGPEGLINAWPLDEAYIDYVIDAPDAGIINNLTDYPELSAELITSLNEAGAEENISAGFHAVEFLLWGQDTAEDGAGQRTFADYVLGGEVANADRRGQYLLLVAEQLVANLTELKTAWDPTANDNYRMEFLTLDPDEAISKVLTGLGVLSKSELAGERMFTALDNRDQEDEHSCFSDNTHRDIINNAQGIRNVYLGSYTRLDGSLVSGTSLANVVAAVDPEVNAQLLALLDKSMAQVIAIHVPFDQAIDLNEERSKVLNAVMTLQDQGDKIAEIASLLGLTINTALPQ